MEYRPLKLTVVSAEGIKSVKHIFSKMDAYADVSLAGYPRSLQRTPVDRHCGTNPKWNHSMEFIIDEPYLTQPGLDLLFQIKDAFTAHPVAVLTIPIHNLYRSVDHEAAVRNAEYQLYTPSGKPKGTLKIAYHFGDKFTHEVKAPAPPVADAATSSAAAPYPGYGYPPQYAPPIGYPAPYPVPQYGYNPAGYGYGYQVAPPPDYGYQYGKPKKEKKHKNKMGMGSAAGMGLAGLGAGLLGGLAVGEMAAEVEEAAAYADGYGDALGDLDI